MKRLTAVLALVTVIGLMIATSAPASAAPRTTTNPSVVSLLERVLGLFGIGAPAVPTMGQAPKTGGTAPAPTVSPDEVIWGGGRGCKLAGTC
jgi:hypothetical protein